MRGRDSYNVLLFSELTSIFRGCAACAANGAEQITLADVNLMLKAMGLDEEETWQCIAYSGADASPEAMAAAEDQHGHTMPSLMRR